MLLFPIQAIMIEQQFFELIQVAVGCREKLTYTPTTDEWNELFALSKKQSLVAITFIGLKKQRELKASEDGACWPDKKTYLKWLGLSSTIVQRNRDLNTKSKELCSMLEREGFEPVVLKGQANQELYSEGLRMCRTAGDIDLWVRPKADSRTKGGSFDDRFGKETVIRYVLQHTPESQRERVIDNMRQHHIDYPYFADVEVEVHFTPAYLRSPFKNRRLQRWFQENKDDCYMSPLGFKVGGVGFNAVYQMVHIYKHLFSEGIGLRQLLDYYFVLWRLDMVRNRQSADDEEPYEGAISSNEEIMKTLSNLGMKRFASAVMWVLQEVFAMPSSYLICSPNEKAGRFLLDEIMLAGNFGKYDERQKGMRSASKLKRFFMLTCRNWRFFRQYPSEVFWDPFCRAYNVAWRQLELRKPFINC